RRPWPGGTSMLEKSEVVDLIARCLKSHGARVGIGGVSYDNDGDSSEGVFDTGSGADRQSWVIRSTGTFDEVDPDAAAMTSANSPPLLPRSMQQAGHHRRRRRLTPPG